MQREFGFTLDFRTDLFSSSSAELVLAVTPESVSVMGLSSMLARREFRRLYSRR
jgi:hypothetical protein